MKNVKILQFPAKHAEEFRSGQRAEYNVKQILARNVLLPEVDTARDFWLPTAEQTTEFEALTVRPRGIKETGLQENARRKAQNEITMTRIDSETKVLQERQDTISKLMGDILEDLTKEGTGYSSLRLLELPTWMRETRRTLYYVSRRESKRKITYPNSIMHAWPRKHLS